MSSFLRPIRTNSRPKQPRPGASDDDVAQSSSVGSLDDSAAAGPAGRPLVPGSLLPEDEMSSFEREREAHRALGTIPLPKEASMHPVSYGSSPFKSQEDLGPTRGGTEGVFPDGSRYEPPASSRRRSITGVPSRRNGALQGDDGAGMMSAMGRAFTSSDAPVAHQSPINPGATSIYRTWPPTSAAPPWLQQQAGIPEGCPPLDSQPTLEIPPAGPAVPPEPATSASEPPNPSRQGAKTGLMFTGRMVATAEPQSMPRSKTDSLALPGSASLAAAMPRGALAQSPRKTERTAQRSAIVLWLALGLIAVLIWGLRESDRVEHLKGELTRARERQRNLTRLIRHPPPIAPRLGSTDDPPSHPSFIEQKVPSPRSQDGVPGACAAVEGGSEQSGAQCKGPKGDAVVVLPPEIEAALKLEEYEAQSEGPVGAIKVDHVQLRRISLLLLLLLLVVPILLIYYMDDIPHWLGQAERCPAPSEGLAEAIPLSKKLAYKVDVWFSTYSWVKSVALLVATFVLIAYGGLALYAVSGDEGLDMVDATWRAWTYVADAGNHADSTGLGPRIVSVCVSFGGMLIFALMVGLVTESISEKVDSLRKGRSDVIETNHTLVLGWSDKLASLVKQLILANESAGGGVIVVMAEREKEEMESEIAKMEFDFKGTSVICRTGSALVPADLKKVNVSTARAIVVLAEDENADAADAHALRVVLSLCGMREGLRGHIVVELSDVDSDQLVKMVGGQIVETVVAHDVIGRLMIQCARQPGLAQIWETILGFENCEFYSKDWPELVGRTFREVLVAFPDAIPIGLKVQGYMVLNPNDEYVLQCGDEVLVIAEDDDSYTPASPAAVRDVLLPQVFMPPKLPEKILFCGWRRDIDDMIVVLEAFLARGSELWIFSDVPIEEREERLMEGGLNPNELENVSLVHRLGNAVIRRHLESLPMETFDSILILADERHEDSIINCDSRSLATLLLIRDIQSKRIPQEEGQSRASVSAAGSPQALARAQGGGGAPHSHSSWVRQMQQASQKSIVISEILDSRTRSLVSVSKISDYVLSNELVSMALAMVAEDRAINQVLAELFAEEGNEMYIRPAELYIHQGEVASFFELMARARKRREIMIGYKRASDENAVINPADKWKSTHWNFSDSFVVLSFEQ